MLHAADNSKLVSCSANNVPSRLPIRAKAAQSWREQNTIEVMEIVPRSNLCDTTGVNCPSNVLHTKMEPLTATNTLLFLQYVIAVTCFLEKTGRVCCNSKVYAS